VRFRECTQFPLGLPDHALSGRALLDDLVARTSLDITPALQSNSFEMMRNFARASGSVCCQIQIGADTISDDAMLAVPLEERGFGRGKLALGVLRGRALPVAAAQFLEFLKSLLLGNKG